MSIAEIITANVKLRKYLFELEWEYSNRRKAIEDNISTNLKSIAVGFAGLDLRQVKIAKSILEVKGTYEAAGADRDLVVTEVMQILANPKTLRRLFSEYFGTKNYDRWRGQRVSGGYFTCPRHGSVVFSLGLNRETRKRLPQNLTLEEVGACLYYLSKIEEIQGTERAACQG